MSTAATPTPSAISLDRPRPRVGFSATLLRLELMRVLRNRRTMIFTVVMPVAFFFMFGTRGYASERYGSGNVGAIIMIGMALYGALAATTGAGAAVSTERATGWSRQLRLTPLPAYGYIAAKAASGLLISAVAVLAVYACGRFTTAQMPLSAWLLSGLVVWFGSIVFVAFGLFIGYLVPTENAMQIAGPLMALLAILGGLWMPIDEHSLLGAISRLTPMYGLRQLALAPLGHGDFSWGALVNVVVWFLLFAGGAAWRMSKDTARV